jgi:hypothetical protein
VQPRNAIRVTGATRNSLAPFRTSPPGCSVVTMDANPRWNDTAEPGNSGNSASHSPPFSSHNSACRRNSPAASADEPTARFSASLTPNRGVIGPNPSAASRHCTRTNSARRGSSCS